MFENNCSVLLRRGLCSRRKCLKYTVLGRNGKFELCIDSNSFIKHNLHGIY